MTKKQIQREVFDLAFESLGGLTKLVKWAKSSDDNYKEFLKMFVKLVPPIKPGNKGLETHESFIKMIMKEEEKRLSTLGQPQKLIDVNVIDSQSHSD